jgi:hypothetical protein
LFDNPAVNIQPLVSSSLAFAASGFLAVIFSSLLRKCHTTGVVPVTTAWLTAGIAAAGLAVFPFFLSVLEG